MSYESLFDLEGLSDSSDIFAPFREITDGVTLERSETAFSPPEGTEGTEGIVGNPEADMKTWYMQEDPYSCALCCQGFINEQVTGEVIGEEELIETATQKGWFIPGAGTPPEDVGKMLETMGFEINQEFGSTVEDLRDALTEGKKIICSVNNVALDNPLYGKLPWVHANHAVQVIGIDYTNEGKTQVILNDPGVSGGRGRAVDVDTFESAWKTGGRYAVTAWKGE